MLAKTLKLMAFYAFLIATAIGSAQASENTNAAFLKLSPEYREGFYFGAYSTMSHVLASQNKELGQCFANWFMQQPVQRIQEIETEMRENPERAPSTILIGLPQLECGRIK
jgi:hypothetical protein